MKLGFVRILTNLAIGAAIAAVLAGPALAFTGQLSSNTLPPGIAGTGFWVATGPVQLSWTVNPDVGVPGLWNYSYTLTVPDGEISHFILEASPGLEEDDLFGVSGTFTDIEINTYTATGPGNSNPNLPGPIFGIKFDEVDATTGVFSFKTFRDPIWGDFYAKNGTAHNDPGVFNTAWNAGFALADPTDPPGDGSITGHILVPDTGVPPIPDASTLVLAAVGVLPLLAARRRLVRQ